MAVQNDLKPSILEHINMYLECAFSPDGTLLAVTGHADDSQTYVQDEPGSKEYRALEMTGPERQSHVFVWDVRAGRQRSHWESDAIEKALFAPNGLTLATAHADRVCLRDAVTGQVQTTPLENLGTKYAPGFWTLAFSPDGSSLAAGLENSGDVGSAYVVSLGQDNSVLPLSAANDGEIIPSRSVAQCRFLPGNRLLVGTGWTYDTEDFAYLWDLTTGKKRLTFGGESDEFEGEGGRGIILSPDGTQFVLTPEDRLGEASLQGLVGQGEEYSWQEQCTFGDERGATGLGRFSPDGRLFAAPKSEGADFEGDVPADSAVTLWEMPTGKKRASFTVPGRCYCWAFSPDGGIFATLSGIPEKHYWGGAPEYLLHLWNAETGQELAALRTESRKTNQLFHEPERAVFSPDGRFLAVSHLRHAELWNMTEILG